MLVVGEGAWEAPCGGRAALPPTTLPAVYRLRFTASRLPPTVYRLLSRRIAPSEPHTRFVDIAVEDEEAVGVAIGPFMVDDIEINPAIVVIVAPHGRLTKTIITDAGKRGYIREGTITIVVKEQIGSEVDNIEVTPAIIVIVAEEGPTTDRIEGRDTG